MAEYEDTAWEELTYLFHFLLSVILGISFFFEDF